MLLKAIPTAEQQALVTDRVLSSTAIIYKLLVRFQPGGAFEKQLLLSHLTMFPEPKDVTDVAAGIRNWRPGTRVEVTLPDGVLLLTALDTPLHFLGTFSPSDLVSAGQSHIAAHQQPTHQNLWAFSQCLLAEAETLALLKNAPSSTAEPSPLKLKQMQGDLKTPPRSTTTDGPKKTSALVDKPCKYFISESGCKAGKACKWSHSWDGIDDEASRCWLCEGKDHGKSECRLRSGGKQQCEPTGSGGGRGAGGGGNGASSTSTSTPHAVGAKAGAAAEKNLGPGIATAPEVTSSTSTTTESKGGGSGGSDGGTKNHKTIELLHEATAAVENPQSSLATPS